MLTLVSIFILLLVNAVFVAAEFASVSVPVVRIEQLAEEGNTLARLLLPNIRDPISLRRYVGACQVGITASSLFLGASGQDSIAAQVSPYLEQTGLSAVTAATVATVATLIVLTTLQVVLGELVPKSVAMRYPERVATWLSVVLTACQKAFSLPLNVIDATARVFLKMMRIELHGERHVHSPEEIELLIIKGHEKGEFEDEEHKRLVRVLRFGERQVREVMIPRTRMRAIDRTAAPDEILNLAATSPYTRIPVYHRNIDNVVGLFHCKDVALALAQGRAISMDRLLRPIPMVPFAMKCDEVLQTLRRERAQMAIVGDEYGGTAGLVTMENLFEEVLGDVQDEFDREAPSLQPDGDGAWLARGDLSLADLEEELDHACDEEDVTTVGGLVMKLLGRAPQTGDHARGAGLVFDVVEARGRRVHLVRLRKDARGDA
ncbi:MAG: HlyC/CorC family transporter [Proteobacteria bacterium]|nr:HlyC/CorC family transporter [Pseudomonadota bacterium]